MTADAWLQVFRQEYLSGFIAGGGSCVKIVTAHPTVLRKELAPALTSAAAAQNFRYILLDSAATKLHLIDKLFHGLALRIDWRSEVMSFLAKQLRQSGYDIDATGNRLDLANVALKNRVAQAAVLNTLQSVLKHEIVDDLDMTIEFRYAMMHLCLSRVYRDGTPLSELEPHIMAWLNGDLSSIVTLRKAAIFQRVGRHSGRHLVYSLAKWLRKCDLSGLILALDISRYLLTVKTIDRTEGFYYTPANTGDLYEVLRECIDDIDKAAGIVVLVLATSALLDDARRGLDMYQALKMRVFDDVRVKGYENPVGPLVRLSSRGSVSGVA